MLSKTNGREGDGRWCLPRDAPKWPTLLRSTSPSMQAWLTHVSLPNFSALVTSHIDEASPTPTSHSIKRTWKSPSTVCHCFNSTYITMQAIKCYLYPHAIDCLSWALNPSPSLALSGTNKFWSSSKERRWHVSKTMISFFPKKSYLSCEYIWKRSSAEI